jgi:serine/threonine protein kinase
VNAYRISHYNILAKLGAGGMGEVYKAHDVTLDRPVALKILPLQLVEDEDRLRRFVKEAKSASALNHPHIITIYEVGEAKAEIVEAKAESKGTPESATGPLVSLARKNPIHYIAMEYIEGETLHTMIHRDQTNLRKLLEYLVQAADGLTKAHSAGIVHRDLKPDNIMINRDGYAKILDFGLAKLVEPARQITTEIDREEAATALLRRTQPGAVMGTAGYMSPEQAQGRAVDQRSDIFAFGCILYEAVTGHKPFAGDSLIDSLHKIIYLPAPPVKDFNQNCPYEIQRIIRRCLAKDPEDRYQRVKDIATDLRDFLEESKAALSGSGIHSGITITPQGSGELLLDAPVVESHLDESDPRVLQLTRFSRASVTLAIVGLLGAIALWPLHQRSQIGSELKLDYTREAALSKAREVVASLGYNTSNLEKSSRFTSTNLDLKYLVNKEGRGAAQRAVREGKTAIWQFLFARSSDEAAAAGFGGNLKPGQFLVTISPQGQLISFSTPPQESGEIAAVDQKQAAALAAEQARRWLSFEPAGYDPEVIARSNPPGLVEVSWRNPNPVLAHKEIVRADLQGTRVTKLSRQLDPPQSIKETSSFSDAASKARTVLLVFTFVAMYAFGVVFLISGKRWYALGRKLPIAATVLVGLGILTPIYFESPENSPLGLFLASLVLILMFSVAFFPSGAGFFEWLRVYNPVRLFGVEQLVKRRIFSRSAASALVHGVLGGALLAAIFAAMGFITTRIPGSIPSVGEEIERVNSGWPLIVAVISSATVGLIFAGGITILVELTERLVLKGILASVIPALLIAVAITSYSEQRWVLVGLSFLSTFMFCLLAVYLYRTRGLAAVWLALSTSFVFEAAVRTHYLQDPGFVWQSNLLVLYVVLLLIAGVWGYLQGRLRTTLNAFALK